MMLCTPSLRSILLPLGLGAALGLGASASAQSLQLDVVGGAMPGSFALDLYPSNAPGAFGIIVPSFNRGPTPLSLIDPNDPRSLGVGAELLGSPFVGVHGFDLHLNLGPYSLAALPAFVDLPIFFQGANLDFGATLVGALSNVNVIRLGMAGTFRDRIVTFFDDRAFASVLPRADGRWMVVGGSRGALLAQVAHATTSIYDPLTDQCTVGPTMTTERAMHSQTLLNDGRWLLVGGLSLSNDPQALCEVYDPAADTFTAVASMNVPRTGHTATLLLDGRVLVTGGLEAMSVTPTQLSALRDATDTAEIYDPVADAWTAVPDLSVPRAAHAAMLRSDGKVLLAGGISWYSVPILGWLPTVRSSTDLYDPVTNTMASGPGMANARSFLEPLALGGDRWLLAGGIRSLTLTNPGVPTASAEIYDGTTGQGSWSSVGSMASARAFHKGWGIGGGQYVLAGGADGTILSPLPSAASEVFSTATNSFQPGPSMSIPRAAPAVIRTPYGQIHLFGGGSTNGSITNSTEFYY